MSDDPIKRVIPDRPVGIETSIWSRKQVKMQFQGDFLTFFFETDLIKAHADLLNGREASGDVCEVPLDRFMVQHRWYGRQIIKKSAKPCTPPKQSETPF